MPSRPLPGLLASAACVACVVLPSALAGTWHLELTSPPARWGGPARLELPALDAAGGPVWIDGSGRAASAGTDAFRLSSVHDALGRELPARLVPSGAGVAIELDDAGALYPVRLEADLGPASWSVLGGQQDAFLGVSVARAGDVNGDGVDDLVVGAFQYDNGQLDEGRALVYAGSPSGLSNTPLWTMEGNQAGAFFGRRVVGAGDVNGDGFDDLLIAATSFDNGQVNEGRVSLYLGSATGPRTTPAWNYECNQSEAACGISIAGAGDVNRDGRDDVLVGTANWDTAQADAGKAELFLGAAGGLQATPAWSFTGSQAGELLGLSVAAAGDLNRDGFGDVIVGATGWSNGESGEGRALVFHGRASGLGATPAWSAEGGQAGAAFGQSVSGAGDTNGDGWPEVIVGARVYDRGETDEGAAFVYAGSAAGLSAAPVWSADPNQPGASFGVAVAGVGDHNGDGYADVMIGAFLHDGTYADEGKGFLYLGSASGLQPAPGFVTEGGAVDTRLGYSLGSAGDVNADGRPDLVVGAHFFTGGASREGKAIVFYGPVLAPPPSLGGTLRVTRQGSSARLDWQQPESAPGAGPVTFYAVHRDAAPNGSFPEIARTGDPFYLDPGAAGASPRTYCWLVSAENTGPLP
ncbi:MAG: FG-GAP-like repeat-containing protein [Acidobacteria bacterium]|jgi:hypothetical protein|nr:FG-GAP-like repeat-containing protein [Acidobacteriota bacterium]